MIWKLDNVVEFEIETVLGEILELRIEIFLLHNSQDMKKFKCRVFRYEAFNTLPAFENDPNFQKATHIWAILDQAIEFAPANTKNAEEATAWFLQQLFRKLGLVFDKNWL